MAFDISKWLPLILAGGQTVGSILGAKSQNNALQKSSDIQAQGSKDALAAMLGMWSTQRNDLAPYRQNGVNAIPELMRLTYRGRPGTPGSPGGAPVPGMNGVPLPTGGDQLPQSIQNLMAGKSASSGAPASVASLLSDNRMPSPGKGPAIASGVAGTLGGMIAGGGIPGLASLGVGTGIGAAAGLGSLAGPIGAGVGVLTGLLASRLGRRGREKTAASNGANEFSDWFWKDIYPKYQSGEIDKATLEGAAKQGWTDYSDWLGNADTKDNVFNDQTVIDRSRTSQKDYFNQGLSQFGFQV